MIPTVSTVPTRRTRRLLPVLLPTLALFTACTFHTYGDRTFRERVEVAKNDLGDGLVETFVVEASNGSEPKLEMHALWHRERPSLGLLTVDLDRDAAAKRGIDPYRGVLVTGTGNRSAAVEAGVLVGDVVLSVGGTKTVYADQIAIAEEKLKPGQPDRKSVV